MRDADQLNSILVFVEVAIIGEYGRFVHRAMQSARGSKLYRQELKRTLNCMKELSGKLTMRCRQVDYEALLAHVVEIMPAYRSAYIAEGGGSVDRLQGNWRKYGIGQLLDRLYEQTLTLCRLAKAREEELTAAVYVVNALATTGVEAYNVVAKQQDELLAGDIIVHRNESGHNRRMALLSHRAMELLMDGDVNVISRFGMASQQARDTIEELHRKISGTEFAQVCNQSLQAASMEFTEYALAHLRVDMELGKVPAEVRGQIGRRLEGGVGDADRLMDELRRVPLPAPAVEVDIWDYAAYMPPGERGGALSRFRRWTVERMDLPDLN